MFRKRETLQPAEKSKTQAQEAPQYSDETLSLVQDIDNSLADSKNLLSGLDQLAKAQVLTDWREREEIEAPKQIGKLNLEKYDANLFEKGGRWLGARNLIYGVKHTLKGKEGVVDTRKLKEEVKEQKYDLNKAELKKLKKFGLDPKKINPEDFKITFIEGEKGKSAEKVVLRRKTEEEMIKTADEIMERRLKELETGAGAKLIKNKESFDGFMRDRKKYEDILPPESLEKLEREETDRREIIERQQRDLNSELAVFGEPLLEKQQNLDWALADFSILLNQTAVQEKYYQDEIASLQKTITGVKSSEELSKVLGDDIKDWAEQKAQARANLKGLEEAKEKLNARITELKKSQPETEAALERINNIGKTETELKAEKTAKQREKLERQKRNRESVRLSDLASDSTGAEGAGGEETRQAIDEPGVRPAERKLKTDNKKLRTAAMRPLYQPAAEQAAEVKPAEREKIEKLVSQWLDLLNLKNAVGPAKTAVENNFKAGKIFNLNSPITLSQAKQNYTQYLIDFLKITNVRAQRQANDKFEKIIEKLSV